MYMNVRASMSERTAPILLLALVVILARPARAQPAKDRSPADTSVTTLVAAWASLGLGGATGSAHGIGAVLAGNLSVGPALLTYRISDFGPFLAAGGGTRDNALLVGARTPGRRLFASAAVGFAVATPYRQECEECGVTKAGPRVGAIAYDVRLHANLTVPGVALSWAGAVGAPRVTYSSVTLALELGWFGD
jgi:hypothetical protein